MGLTDEQKKVMDGLLKAHTEMCESCIEKIYSQGLKDSVEILQELGVLRVDICRIKEWFVISLKISTFYERIAFIMWFSFILCLCENADMSWLVVEKR